MDDKIKAATIAITVVLRRAALMMIARHGYAVVVRIRMRLPDRGRTVAMPSR
jgi:hypothetical protein